MVKITMATYSSSERKNEDNDFISAAGGESPGQIRLLHLNLCNLSVVIDSKRPVDF